jgi:hypothetical protein
MFAAANPEREPKDLLIAGCRARTGPSKTDPLPMQSRFG